METTSSILKQMINQVNLKLAEMEKGYYIELNVCILDLVKVNDRYCLLVESDRHEMFKFLMYIENFIYAFVELKERCELKERGE